MADGLRIESTGSDAAVRKLMERAERARDLTPFMKVLAVEIDRETDVAFTSSRSPAGETFPRLAPSTVLARAAKLPGANRRNKKTGKLTSGSRTKRRAASALYEQEVYQAHGGHKVFRPLIDTGRARGSAHATGDASGASWSAVKYLEPHVTGGLTRPGRPPKRNVSVLEMRGGVMRPIPRIESMLLRGVATYVSTGQVTVT